MGKTKVSKSKQAKNKKIQKQASQKSRSKKNELNNKTAPPLNSKIAALKRTNIRHPLLEHQSEKTPKIKYSFNPNQKGQEARKQGLLIQYLYCYILQEKGYSDDLEEVDGCFQKIKKVFGDNLSYSEKDRVFDKTNKCHMSWMTKDRKTYIIVIGGKDSQQVQDLQDQQQIMDQTHALKLKRYQKLSEFCQNFIPEEASKILVGHSLGGRVAFESKYPHNIVKRIGFNPAIQPSISKFQKPIELPPQKVLYRVSGDIVSQGYTQCEMTLFQCIRRNQLTPKRSQNTHCMQNFTGFHTYVEDGIDFSSEMKRRLQEGCLKESKITTDSFVEIIKQRGSFYQGKLKEMLIF